MQGVSYEVGAELSAAASAEVHVVVDAFREPRASENVVADSGCGDPNQTIVVGHTSIRCSRAPASTTTAAAARWPSKSPSGSRRCLARALI